MNSRKARPIFRVLACVLAVGGIFGAIVIGFSKLDHDGTLAGVGAFVGGGLFSLAMLFVAITGKVPILLAWFLAPPPAWKDYRNK